MADPDDRTEPIDRFSPRFARIINISVRNDREMVLEMTDSDRKREDTLFRSIGNVGCNGVRFTGRIAAAGIVRPKTIRTF